MPLYEVDLKKALKNQYPMSDEDIVRIIYDLSRGMAVMHEKNYLYGDFKLDNCFLYKKQGKWRAVLADFGRSSDTSKRCYGEKDLKNEVRRFIHDLLCYYYIIN